jgi:hypothetical protein
VVVGRYCLYCVAPDLQCDVEELLAFALAVLLYRLYVEVRSPFSSDRLPVVEDHPGHRLERSLVDLHGGSLPAQDHRDED